MRQYEITLKVSLNNDAEPDFIADAICEQLERYEDLISFNVEEVTE
jgi:hypothetical protein